MVMNLKAIRRKAELLEENKKKYLESKGWKHVMLGYYWVWERSEFTDYNGKQVFPITVTLDNAMRFQEIIEELTR
jgi:hypothetical protein